MTRRAKICRYLATFYAVVVGLGIAIIAVMVLLTGLMEMVAQIVRVWP